MSFIVLVLFLDNHQRISLRSINDMLQKASLHVGYSKNLHKRRWSLIQISYDRWATAARAGQINRFRLGP